MNNPENLELFGFMSAGVSDIISNKKASLGNSLVRIGFKESGRKDSNLRPSTPKGLNLLKVIPLQL